MFPTAVRAGAQGLSYNLGRGFSAAAPYLVGAVASQHGLGFALLLTSGSFLVAGIIALMLPETRGRELEFLTNQEDREDPKDNSLRVD
jgi:hypothetical protein